MVASEAVGFGVHGNELLEEEEEEEEEGDFDVGGDLAPSPKDSCLEVGSFWEGDLDKELLGDDEDNSRRLEGIGKSSFMSCVEGTVVCCEHEI